MDSCAVKPILKLLQRTYGKACGRRSTCEGSAGARQTAPYKRCIATLALPFLKIAFNSFAHCSFVDRKAQRRHRLLQLVKEQRATAERVHRYWGGVHLENVALFRFYKTIYAVDVEAV